MTQKQEIANFGIRHKNKSFSDIMAIAYDDKNRESIDLFFLEIMKSSSKLSTYFDKPFLEKSKGMLKSLYDNSRVIDKDLQNYLDNIEIGLKKF
jgi:hypothetical protein